MKKIKLIIILCLLVILTGCSFFIKNEIPFEVGNDSVEYIASDASAYSPTFSVNFLIVGGNNEELFNGKVTLTSNTMWCSEFISAICETKGIALEGVKKGNITKIGNYEANVSKNIYWFYDLNGEEALFGVDHLQLRDGDYVKFYYSELQ